MGSGEEGKKRQTNLAFVGVVENEVVQRHGGARARLLVGVGEHPRRRDAILQAVAADAAVLVVNQLHQQRDAACKRPSLVRSGRRQKHVT